MVLPDYEDEQTVCELAKRFNYTNEQLTSYIAEAKEYFASLRQFAHNEAQISIWLLPATPQFSFYRFDRVGILALYTHRRERAAIQTFVCESGGTLYDFIRQEFKTIIAPERSRPG